MIDTKKIEIKDGKNTLKFEIRKMDAVTGERWFLKAISLVGKGLKIDVGAIAEANLSVNDLVMALCNVPFDEAMVLLNELLKCAYRIIDGKNSEQVDIDLCTGYISSPMTLLKLRMEIAKFNFSFFSEINGLVTQE
jgi:hypothetical protein